MVAMEKLFIYFISFRSFFCFPFFSFYVAFTLLCRCLFLLLYFLIEYRKVGFLHKYYSHRKFIVKIFDGFFCVQYKNVRIKTTKSYYLLVPLQFLLSILPVGGVNTGLEIVDDDTRLGVYCESVGVVDGAVIELNSALLKPKLSSDDVGSFDTITPPLDDAEIMLPLRLVVGVLVIIVEVVGRVVDVIDDVFDCSIYSTNNKSMHIKYRSMNLCVD